MVEVSCALHQSRSLSVPVQKLAFLTQATRLGRECDGKAKFIGRSCGTHLFNSTVSHATAVSRVRSS